MNLTARFEHEALYGAQRSLLRQQSQLAAVGGSVGEGGQSQLAALGAHGALLQQLAALQVGQAWHQQWLRFSCGFIIMVTVSMVVFW